MRCIFLSASVLLIAISTYAQTGNSPQPCKLKLSEAPAVRGVKLGMMADELFPLFSSGSEASARIKQNLSAAEGYSNFGYANLGLNLSDAANKEQFAGINAMRVSTFDRRIVVLGVQYDQFPKGARWKNSDDLIQRFSDAFHFPGPKEWVNDPDSNHKKLVCAGFDVFVSAGDQAGIVFVNRDWQQTQKDRAAAFEDQRRHEFKP